MTLALLPAFLVTTLGVSTPTVGVIEGIADATAPFAKIFSGAISDWGGRRKPLVLRGYGLAAAMKPFFALATSAGTALAARFVGRACEAGAGGRRVDAREAVHWTVTGASAQAKGLDRTGPSDQLRGRFNSPG